MRLGYGKAHAQRGLILAALCGASLFFSVACNDTESRRVIPPEIEFRPDGVVEFLRQDGSVLTRIVIEMAISDSSQARGLMDRRSLPARGGMLFINPESSERSFWMKKTPLPLDILFIGSDSSIVNIVRRTTPYSEDFIKSEGPAQFVLEVRAGFTERYGITDRHSVRWSRQE